MNRHAYLAAASACAHEMMRNASFIDQSIRGMELPEEIAASIRDLCDEWISTKFDVISELAEIHELEIQGESVEGIERRLLRIHRWLMESVGESTRCVRRLGKAADRGDVDGSVLVLVVESATNVLKCTPGKATSEDRSIS